MDPSTVKIIFTNKTDCEFTGRFTENKFDGNDKKEELNTVMSVKMAGQNGAKQIIRADAEFTGTVEVESGTLIMHSTAALGKLTMTGGAFGGIDGGVKVSEAEWLGGDIVFHNAEAFMGGSPDKITVDGTFAKTGEGKIGVDFSGLDASIFVEDGNLVFDLITANALEGFSADANDDFAAKNAGRGCRLRVGRQHAHRVLLASSGTRRRRRYIRRARTRACRMAQEKITGKFIF